MGIDRWGREGQERLWSAMDQTALEGAEEARRLAREAVAKHTLRPERFKDPLEGHGGVAWEPERALADPLSRDGALIGPDGSLYDGPEIERILRAFFASQEPGPGGVNPLGEPPRESLAGPVPRASQGRLEWDNSEPRGPRGLAAPGPQSEGPKARPASVLARLARWVGAAKGKGARA